MAIMPSQPPEMDEVEQVLANAEVVLDQLAYNYDVDGGSIRAIRVFSTGETEWYVGDDDEVLSSPWRRLGQDEEPPSVLIRPKEFVEDFEGINVRSITETMSADEAEEIREELKDEARGQLVDEIDIYINTFGDDERIVPVRYENTDQSEHDPH